MTKDELRGMMAGAIYARFAGGASDDADDMAATLSLDFADAVLSALRDAGLAIVPKVSTTDMKFAATDAMIVLVEADNAKCPEETDFQRGMASGAAMTCGSKYLDAAYRAMLSAGDLLGERGS